MTWSYNYGYNHTDGPAEWWNIIDDDGGDMVIGRVYTEKHAKQIVTEHNAHEALLAACKEAYAECEQDEWEKSPLGLQLKAAVDLAKPSDVAAEKGE